jgi:hypothetical protein
MEAMRALPGWPAKRRLGGADHGGHAGFARVAG